jgi:hypothetical protein
MTEPPIDPSSEPTPAKRDEDADETAENAAERARDQEDSAPEYVDDSQLPEDLRPTDDNPLAQNPDE